MMTSINIVCMDHYLHSPLEGLDPYVSQFRASSIDKVPVIRIYGSTDKGLKACAHIHNVFPYFYVRCDNNCNDPFATAFQLASALDKAINITLNQATSSQQHIYSITVENGIPFYGYHAEENKFLKISFYNPYMIKKASTLLQSGNILGTIFQPYECHIPYKQQFMIDFNLFGMNFIHFKNIIQRNDQKLKKQTICSFEFDVLASDILNQHDIVPGNIVCNPGLKYIRDEELKRSDNNSEVLKENLTQNRINIEPTLSDKQYKEKLYSLLYSGKKKQTLSSQNEDQNLSISSLDISVLDDTQLEEHAELLLQFWNANVNENDHSDNEKLDDDCILSQHIQLPQTDQDEEGEFNLNMSLLDCLTNLGVNDFAIDTIPPS